MSRVFCLLLSSGLLLNAGASANPPALATDIQPADIAQLVEQLESPAFAERQEATRALSEAGKAAFDELERAMQSGSREASGRALDVLKGHFQRGDNEMKAAAQASLERLAASSNATLAERAKNVLKPPATPTAADIAAFNAAPFRVANLQLQIAAQNANPNARSSSVTRNADGSMKITIRENGKTTQIQSKPGAKIEVEITDSRNAQANKKFDAKDLDELKQKDADVARLYEQYNQPRIQIGAIRPAGAVLPNRIVPAPLPPAEMLKQRLQTLDGQIQRIEAQLKDNPAAQRSLDSLKNMRSRFEQELKEAEKAAPAAPPADAAAEAKAVGGQ